MKNLILFLFIALTVQLNAQNIIGDWYGKITYQGVELRMVFHITQNNGTYQSTMDSPDQNVTGFAVDKTTFGNGKLSIEANALQMKYTAELDSLGKSLRGTFNQRSLSLPLIMTKAEEEKSSINLDGMDSNEVLGDWNGLLEISGRQLPIIFHIIETDGQLKSTLDSPEQNANGIQMDKTTFEDGKLQIVAKAINAEYIAELGKDADTLKGIFKQSGMSFDLTMTRKQVESKAIVKPQVQKVILITGTASGIGKAAAEALIEKGHTVYGGDIQGEKNLYLNDIGGHALIMDVTKDDQVNAGVQKVIDEQGRIDVLINNAGYGSFATIENIDMDELKYQFDVNVFGYARLQQAVLPHMREQRSGMVIEVSSVVGEISYPMLGWYAATKHAVEAMADALRQEVAPFGIDVVKIQPGAVKTNFPNVALAKLNRSNIPEDYKQLAADFKLVVEGTYAYNAESLDGTIDHIVKAIETEEPETEYRTTLSSRMAIQSKISMSEREHDQLNSGQFQQAVNYLRRMKTAEKEKR